MVSGEESRKTENVGEEERRGSPADWRWRRGLGENAKRQRLAKAAALYPTCSLRQFYWLSFSCWLPCKRWLITAVNSRSLSLS
jgi:hypothetical protein